MSVVFTRFSPDLPADLSESDRSAFGAWPRRMADAASDRFDSRRVAGAFDSYAAHRDAHRRRTVALRAALRQAKRRIRAMVLG